MSLAFEVMQQDGRARLGRMRTSHGTVETPLFMPVGTQATVKGLTPSQLREAGAQLILGNTYHLALRPGDGLIAEHGGLHRFMGWDGPILTDSGGYQVYSLAQNLRIDDRGAAFRSHIDGSVLELTPEKAVAVQENLGSDIAMCLDECPPAGPGDPQGTAETPGPHSRAGRRTDPDRLRAAVLRTIAWARRCRAAHRRADQALFGIVQGGTDVGLRAECAGALTALGFDGYALGGFSVGETPAQMHAALEPSAAALPAERPRYLMGVGRPSDVLEAVACGMDLFDCVLPTRNGRNAFAFTSEGPLRMRNACHKRDQRPIESGCPCYGCRHFSRSYLHHLFRAGEMLGPVLLSLHNVTFYCGLMAEVREAIRGRRFAAYRSARLARWGPTL
jgi:queuine tRNA-ribosyltransferase